MRLNIFNSIFGLCVATVAVSCSNDQVIDGPRPNGGNDSDMISFMVADDYTRGGSFGNRPGSSTRSSVTTPDNINTAGNNFAVYGDMTSLDSSEPIVIFNGEEVKHDGSLWSYSNVRYWFTDREYSFVALYPKEIPGLSSLTYDKNRLAFTYTLPANYKESKDILTATHRRKAVAGNSDKVSFNLDHIMALLNFTVQVDVNSAEGIVIDHLSMTGVVNQASYQITPASLGFNNATDDYFEGTWKLTKQTGSLFDKSFKDLGAILPGNTIPLFKADEDPLIIIPQEVNNDIEVKIKYHYSSEEDNIIEASAKLFSVATSAHNGVWIAGKSYNYTISLGGNDFVIFSTPNVEDWKPAEGGNYIITD